MQNINDVFNVTSQLKNATIFQKLMANVNTNMKDLQKVEQTAETSHNTMDQVVKSLDKVTAKVDETKDISEGLLSPLRRAWQGAKPMLKLQLCDRRTARLSRERTAHMRSPEHVLRRLARSR